MHFTVMFEPWRCVHMLCNVRLYPGTHSQVSALSAEVRVNLARRRGPFCDGVQRFGFYIHMHGTGDLRCDFDGTSRDSMCPTCDLGARRDLSATSVSLSNFTSQSRGITCAISVAP